MYGGTAKTYCEYKQLGQPFKDGKVYYINVEHPKTGATKKVRWYTDKAHADLMPKVESPYGAFCTLFGFEHQDDYILCVKKANITDDEEADYFGCKRGWRFGMFFGGIWYAPKDTELPPIKNQDKIVQIDWDQFKKAGQENSKKLGLVPQQESRWFSE